ncbi:MAG: ligand-gated channel protein, partial [Bacteroidetes bacterium]|nr:ligand-gated channel protein [Bacteroidota bacterium]
MHFMAAMFITALSSNAQERSMQDTTKIDEVVVTGTKTRVSRNNVPLTVSVVTGKQVEESSESALLPVLSEQVPGVFVTERGITGFGVSTGAAGGITIRGVGGNPNTQVLILLNGNPQFMGIMGHPLPDAYIASDVQKVEVIRGPASTLYGSNAMGGVINIITKEQTREGLGANARIMYGSYNTQKYMVNAGLKKKGFTALASFNHDHTDGHRDSSDFTINNGYADLGYEINSHLNLKANFSLANFDATDPGQENAKAGNTIDITRGMGSISFNNRFEKTSGSANFFFNFGEHNITDGFHSNDRNVGTIVYQSFSLFKGNTITLGADFKIYGGMAENSKAMGGNGMVFTDTTVQEIAGYAHVQQLLFEKLMINAGIRLENNSGFGTEPVPSFGLAYSLLSTTTFKASVAKGFRSPTIRELYMWGTANASLEPERMINYEVGVLQKLHKNKISLELTLFKSKGNNMIKAITNEGVTKYQNTGAFSNLGLEFAGTYAPLANLSFRANYTFIHMDQPIIATPEHMVNLNGSYAWKNLAFSLSAQSVRNLYLTVTPAEEKESYTLLHTKIAYKINKYVDVFVKGENLTNAKYIINAGYPMPGFLIF